MSEARPGPPLRIAVLGDFDGLHTGRWLEVFVARGHDVHAISFYPPREPLPGVNVHVLSPSHMANAATGSPSPRKPALSKAEGERGPGGEVTPAGVRSTAPLIPRPSKDERRGISNRWRHLVPPSAMRLVHALRYRRAGLRRALDKIQPDVFHAHYAVEHGFYGSLAGFHPYVVSAWGSDLLVESHKPLGRLIAQRTLSRADFVTGNDASLVARALELGVPPARTAVVHLGTERVFLDAGLGSVNRDASPGPPAIFSDRALEPLYNVDVVLRAFATIKKQVRDASLVVAHGGSQRPELEALSARLGLGDSVRFAGRLDSTALAKALAGAQVYISVPSSDSFAVSTLEAMAAGAFPVLSDLPSTRGWVENGAGALLVPPRDAEALSMALRRALDDASLRTKAYELNRGIVEARGLRNQTMLQMEQIYYNLAGREA